MVVGTGGAARAALLALRDARERTVAGRDAARRGALAREFACDACAIGDIGRRAHDVLVHTTPLGSRTHPGESAVDPAHLRAGTVVLDAVYVPRVTPLLAAARAAGAIAIGGEEWFLRQAVAQFRLLTGVEPDARAMAAELDRALTEAGA